MYSILILFCNKPCMTAKQMPNLFDHEAARSFINVFKTPQHPSNSSPRVGYHVSQIRFLSHPPRIVDRWAIWRFNLHIAVVIKKIPQLKRMVSILVKNDVVQMFFWYFSWMFFSRMSRVPMVLGRCWTGWHLWPLFRGAGGGFFEHPIWFTSACRFAKYRKIMFRY